MPDRRAYEYRKNNIWNHKRWKRSNCLYAAQHSGMRVKISSLGAAIVSVEMKDFAGERKDIVLGYDKVSDYEENGTFFGAAVGRGQTGQKAPDLCWMGQSITFRKMRERITCTVDGQLCVPPLGLCERGGRQCFFSSGQPGWRPGISGELLDYRDLYPDRSK